MKALRGNPLAFPILKIFNFCAMCIHLEHIKLSLQVWHLWKKALCASPSYHFHWHSTVWHSPRILVWAHLTHEERHQPENKSSWVKMGNQSQRIWLEWDCLKHSRALGLSSPSHLSEVAQTSRGFDKLRTWFQKWTQLHMHTPLTIHTHSNEEALTPKEASSSASSPHESKTHRFPG